MAISNPSRTQSNRDFSLYHWTPDKSNEALQTAIRKKWEWVVSEPKSSYMFYSIVLSNLSRTYSSPKSTTIDDVRQVLEEGLKKDAFDRLKLIINTSGDSLSKVIRVPKRTLDRRVVFKPDESERILRVASAFQRAIEVFGELDKARRWFSTPKKALGDRTPMEFCNTELGADEVLNLLGRIQHGVFT